MKKLLLVFAFAVVACGKRGDPHPPVPIIPKATSDLLVTQRGNKVILTWSYPSLTTAGKSLLRVRRVTVYRYVEPLPAPDVTQAPATTLPGDVDTTKPRQLSLFAKIPPVTPPAFNKLKQTVDSIEGANLPAASSGAKLQYEDTPPFHSGDGQPVRITYAVVTFGESARSDLSNLATIVPVDVPVAPSSLEANAQPAGVVLSWTAPAKSATGDEKPFIAGYNVYRVGATAGFDETAAPINSAPVSSTTFTDNPPYGAYRYRVTALAVATTPRIESEPSTDVAVTFKDLMPPPAPASISALVEPKSVRLIWDAVDAPDLAGYNVYRYEGTSRLKLPSPTTATNFVDISIDPGIEYVYAVTSIDKSGNESAETKSEKVLVPKTP